MAYYSQASPSPWFILVFSVAAPGSAATSWLQDLSAGKAAAPKAHNNIWAAAKMDPVISQFPLHAFHTTRVTENGKYQNPV